MVPFIYRSAVNNEPLYSYVNAFGMWIKGFYLPAGVPVEIHPLVLHFAPCRVRQEGFRCLVVLEQGTNQPLAGGVHPDAPGEEALLWMTNKWMVCHPDSPQAAKGAHVGIRGENLQLRL